MIKAFIAWFNRDTDWKFVLPQVHSLEMKRRVDSKWEYRPATPEELEDFLSRDAW